MKIMKLNKKSSSQKVDKVYLLIAEEDSSSSKSDKPQPKPCWTTREVMGMKDTWTPTKNYFHTLHS